MRQVLGGYHVVNAALNGARSAQLSSLRGWRPTVHKLLVVEPEKQKQQQGSKQPSGNDDALRAATQRQDAVNSLKRIAKDKKVTVETIGAGDPRLAEFARKYGLVHQGVLLECDQLQVLEASGLGALHGEAASQAVFLAEGDELKVPASKLWVALDQIQDPVNLGGIIRTCHFYSVPLILTKKASAPLSATVAKASAGALDRVPIVECHNLVHFIQESRKFGWAVGGTDMRALDIAKIDFDYRSPPTILVLGNEGTGVRQKVLNECSYRFSLEPAYNNNNEDSLNVQVACGAILQHFLRSR